MRTLAASLALLALAGAQTVVLTPATTGFSLVYQKKTYTTSVPGISQWWIPKYYQNNKPVDYLQTDPFDALVTKNSSVSSAITQYVKGSNNRLQVVTRTDVDQKWWTASFTLPKTPAGQMLKSATLTATVVGSGTQTVSVGSGYFLVGAGAVGLNLTGQIGSALKAGKSSLALDVTTGISYSSTSNALTWSNPKLYLVYGPQAVPEPATLGALGLLRRRARA